MKTSPSESQITASKNILNNSISKMMYSFPKSPRFPPLKRSSYSYTFYNIPSTLSNRSTSLGYGNKTDFTKMKKFGGEYPEIKRDFDKGTKLGPLFSFGMSRSQVYCSTNIPLGRDAPGPGAYKPKKLKNSPSYSLRGKFNIPLPNRDTPDLLLILPTLELMLVEIILFQKWEMFMGFSLEVGKVIDLIMFIMIVLDQVLILLKV